MTYWSYYPKRYWELLPKEILGAITQRDTGSYYPKRYWELLPKEILGAITQREIGMSYGKMELLFMLPGCLFLLRIVLVFFDEANLEPGFDPGTCGLWAHHGQCKMVSAENNTSGPAPFLNVQKTFDRSRSSLGLHGNDVCSHQFRPRSSSNDF
ncbi:hypothetical protein Tco_0303059 [Tanacetum coccineum]